MTKLCAALSLMLAGPAFAGLTFSFGGSGTETWKSEKGDIRLDYPASWGPVKSLPGGGMQLFRPGRGWFQLDVIDLPEGEDLAGFSEHLIEKSKGEGWDLRLEADLGKTTIGGKASWAHKYRHKSKKRVYYGYLFVPENGTVGIRVLMVKISRRGGEAMMAMLDSLRYPGSEAEPKPAAARTKKEKAPAASPEESPGSSPAAHTEFGTYQEEGIMQGRVLLKDFRDKSALPCYLVFHPVERRCGSLQECEPAGDPVRTATDSRGRYHVDLEEGSYFVEAYDRKGVDWPVLRGESFKRTRAKRLHNIRIDNRR